MSWRKFWKKGDRDHTGSSGKDKLHGGRGDDTIDGGAGNDHIRGGRGDDILNGGDGNDHLHAGSGNDTVDGGNGNDHLRGDWGNDNLNGGAGRDHLDGGWGNDVLDGGAGSDVVHAGWGNDVGVYSVTENQGARDTYDGGHGKDMLVLRMTQAEFDSSAVQADLARFDAFLAKNGHGWFHHGRSFEFKAFDLKAKGWESYRVEITDAGANEAPVANNDTIFASAAVIADLEPNDPQANDLAGSAQAIDRADFRIEVSPDVADDSLPRVSVDGTLNPDSDVDVYAVTLESGETLTMDIDYGFAAGVDDVNTQLFIFEEDGSVTLLAENQFSSTGSGGGGSSSSFDAFLEYTANAPGTYYIAVSVFDNDPTNPVDGTFGGGGGPTATGGGDYVLNLSIAGGAPDLGAFVIAADTLLANDTDADNDALSITGVGNALNGTVELLESGDVRFRPDSEYAGSFEYTISDGQGGESTAIAAINGNSVLGTSSQDTLNSGSGNDLMTGGEGNDIFTFGPGTGFDADTVTDFTVGVDSLALSGGLALDAMNPMEGHDYGTVVNFDSGDSVLLVGVTGVASVDDLFQS